MGEAGGGGAVDDLGQLDGVGQAALVRSGELSALELVEAAIGRIEALNPAVNAVITEACDAARRQAAGSLPTGPLAGVPFLLKDFAAEWEGVRFAEGSAFPGGYVSPRDQEIVARYRRAGLMLCGKTNTPEFALEPTTEPVRFGPTRNPWDLQLSAGGSSGGSAAAVAAGMVPLAHANDGGGSIRIPAAFCGVFGLKPTRGRNPLGPRYGDVLSGLVAEHVVSRTVRDSAAALDATCGSQPGDPYIIPAPVGPYLTAVDVEPPRLRVALATEPFTDVEVDPVCVAAAREAAGMCADLGHEVTEASPQVPGTSSKATSWPCGRRSRRGCASTGRSGRAGPSPKATSGPWRGRWPNGVELWMRAATSSMCRRCRRCLEPSGSSSRTSTSSSRRRPPSNHLAWVS